MTDTQTQATSNLTTLPASPPRYADCAHQGEIIVTDDRPLYCADCGQAIHAESAAIEGYLYHNPGATGNDTMARV